MKKLLAAALALAVMLSIGMTALAADGIPTLQINPQQRGHIAYLESLYGERKAKKIVSDYGKSNPDIPDRLVPNGITEGSGIEIPQPGALDLGTLRVGDYFTIRGDRYVVGRFSQVGPAAVLVAYPVNDRGVSDPGSPRYFYL